jgi:hypothetical protein
MKGTQKFIVVIVLLLVFVVAFITLEKKEKIYTAAPGEIVELSFELDKKFEFGEYYFDLNNGKSATYPLCYCLTEKNIYPPDCSGDVEYIYNNRPGTRCIPLKIGTGRCSVKPISSLGYATGFIIPREYQWTKPVEKIVMGITTPAKAPEGVRLVVAVTIFKQNGIGKLEVYRVYEKTIVVKHSKENQFSKFNDPQSVKPT